MSDKIKTISLFSSAGIAELLLSDMVHKVVSNELLVKRAQCYKYFYPETDVVLGDIQNKEVKNKIVSYYSQDVKLMIITPPCQGLSTLGKNKIQDDYIKDPRNYLIFHAFDIIDQTNVDYILIENVPKFKDMYFPFKGGFLQLEDILRTKYSNKYNIEVKVINSKDYGISQSRPRVIIKMFKKNLIWPWPNKQKEISLEQSISHLPPLEPGEKSNIKWHYAKHHPERISQALRHTRPGKSALTNKYFYPKKTNGDRIKGFHNTYKRMVWENPAPARTTYNGSISSHNNVHPGRLLKNGTYSDPRVLTLLETFIVSSIPEDIEFPPNCSETFIRTLIGESIPPKLMREIIKPLRDVI